MAEAYFDQVNEEFDALGFQEPVKGEPTPWPPDKWTYDTAIQLMYRTRRDAVDHVTGETMPLTYPGRQAVKLIEARGQLDAEIAEIRPHVCCSSAEYMLAESLDEPAIANPHFGSPLIITKDNEPLGFIKGFGEDTFYGLADEPEHSVVKGAFATPVKRFELRVPRAKHAWQLPIEPLGNVIPLRLSLFALPIEKRAKLPKEPEDEDDRACLTTTHEDIASKARQLLNDAKELPAYAIG